MSAGKGECVHLYVGDTPTATNLDAFNFTAEERSIHHMWQMDKVCRSLSVAKSPSTHRPFFLLPRGSHWAVWMHTVNTASPDTAIVTGNVSSSCTRATDPVFFLCCSSEQLEQVDRVAAITEALKAVDPEVQLEFQREARTVQVGSAAEEARLVAALTEAGYPPKLV